MKVYSCPADVPAPPIDYENHDIKAMEKAEAAHRDAIRAWITQQGYTGKNSGKIISFAVGDGCAEYMLAEGRTSGLIHLPYGDAYESRLAHLMTKSQVIAEIKSEQRMNELFNHNKGS
jgi:hypothetical protein